MRRSLIAASVALVALAAVLLSTRSRVDLSNPAAVASAYVDAFNDRDHAEICRLLTPELAQAVAVSHRYATTTPARGCVAELEAWIQNPSDAQADDNEESSFWSKATVLSRRPARIAGGLARVDMRLSHEKVPDDEFSSESSCVDGLRPTGPRYCRSPEVVADRIWLQRNGGGWRVARLGAIYYVAGGERALPSWALDGPLAPAAAAAPARLPPAPRRCRSASRAGTRYADRDPPGMPVADLGLDIRALELRPLGDGGACLSITFARRPGRAIEIGVVYRYHAFDSHDGRDRAVCASRHVVVDRAGASSVPVPHGAEPQGTAAGRRALVGSRAGSATVQFELRDAPGIAGDRPAGHRALRRLSFGVYADSQREPGPEHLRVRRVDAFPSDRRLVSGAARSRGSISECTHPWPLASNSLGG